MSHQASIFDIGIVDDTIIEAYLFFAIELNGNGYSRTQLSNISREINKLFPMPVMLLFKYDDQLTLSVIKRRLHKKDSGKDVLEKVTLIKDISIAAPHRAHVEILFDLSFNELLRKQGFKNFVELHNAWQKTLDTKELNKSFFNDLANWYFWAQPQVSFPAQKNIADDKNTQINLIRLITRLIFVWFLKEKKLVPENLFDAHFIKSILKTFVPQNHNTPNSIPPSSNPINPSTIPPSSNPLHPSTYYTAILQNLFFATLNQAMDKREFAKDADFKTNQTEHGVKTKYRYASQFSITEKEVIKIFAAIPFLNGGLFDCLDKDNDETNKHEYIDGFSRETKRTAIIPDLLFFGGETTEDLTAGYGYKRNKEKCSGLFTIFNKYKFTIEENTPIEEEIALDPELLGKVFENLLAYYNPETESTARKQTGSFYTPREIVNYMVDESLIAYLKTQLLEDNPAWLQLGSLQTEMFGNNSRKGQLVIEQPVNQSKWKNKEAQLETNLRHLLAYNNEPHLFTHDTDIEQIIYAIDHCKILDPACGSGAYPMGILHKLVYVLGKIDPETETGNTRWRMLQKKKAENEVSTALDEKNKALREEKLIEINQIFEDNASDYGRKLYLIENCIYGVDIQPIAVQISKLRFFISLVVDQKETDGKNRGIRPLPNLETKFVAANTLISLQKPEGINFRSQQVIALEAELWQNRHGHFGARTRTQKQNFQKKDKAIRKKIADLIRADYAIYEQDIQKQIAQLQEQLAVPRIITKNPAVKIRYEKAFKEIEKKIDRLQQGLLSSTAIDDTANKIATFDIYDQNASATWFEAEWMFGKELEKGFDVVIGNPPYVQIQKLSVPEKAGLELQPFKTYTRTGDIYQLFYEKGIAMLKDKGNLCYITSNKWMRTDYGETTRKFFSEGLNTKVVVDFGMALIFETAATLTNIILLEKVKSGRFIPMCRIKSDYNLTIPLHTYVLQNAIQVEHPKQKSWIAYDKTEYALIKRIVNQGLPLTEWNVKINRGILTGFNQAFIIDTETRNRLVAEDPKSDEIIKPILRGEDIKAYVPQWGDKWIIGTFPALKIEINEFSAIKRYLETFRKKLEPKPRGCTGMWQGRKSGSYEWFETQDSISYYEDFLKPKIIYPNMTKFMPFVYDKGSFFCNDKAFILSGVSLEYLTLFFNSRLFKFTFKEYFPELLGETRELRKVFFETIAVKPATDEVWYKQMLNKIIDSRNSKLSTEILEQEVDNKIFDDYKLSPSERSVIFAATNDSRALMSNLSTADSE